MCAYVCINAFMADLITFFCKTPLKLTFSEKFKLSGGGALDTGDYQYYTGDAFCDDRREEYLQVLILIDCLDNL